MSCQSCDKPCEQHTNQPEIIGWRFDFIKLTRWLVFISLITAYWLGQSWNQPNWLTQIKEIYPSAEIAALAEHNNVWSIVQTKKQQTTKYTAILTTENSYGGPLWLLTSYDNQGHIIRLDILSNNDTPAYIQKLHNNRYFKQYLKKPVIRKSNEMEINAISGATISSNSIMRAHYHALEQVATITFGQSQTLLKQEIKFEIQHYMLLAFLLLAVVSQWIKHPLFTLGMAIGCLAVMGFWLNQMFSVSTFTTFALGYTPSVYENLSFWILCMSIFAGIIFLGKNIYCGNICPFSALQLLLSKITGLNFPVPKFIQRHGNIIPKFGLWLAVIIGLLTTSPIAGSYEPFSMIFSLEGVGIQWAILPAVVIGSVFIPRLFCRYFCPAGQGLNYLIVLRNWLVARVTKKN